MIEQPSAYPLDHVSVLVSIRDSGRRLYQGTAFPFLRSGLWLTAAHCVCNWRGPNTLALVRTGPEHAGVDSVTSVATHPDLDLAVLASSSANAAPFPEVGVGGWGNEVSVIGYPEDLFLDAQGQDRPRARLLKGHIQRVEQPGPDADREGDFELSFACPGGLSGSPVVLQGGRQVVGVVIGNRDSAAVDHLNEEILADGATRRTEIQRIVSFGSAVDLGRAIAWLALHSG
jgi:hypothetical protein